MNYLEGPVSGKKQNLEPKFSEFSLFAKIHQFFLDNAAFCFILGFTISEFSLID